MDAQTVRALESGDPQALEWIFEAYGYDCVQRLQRYEGCSPEDAEDIFADALLLYWEQVQRGKVRELTRSRSYIYGICVNEQRQRYRQRQQLNNARAEVTHQYEQAYEPPLVDKYAQETAYAEQSDAARRALLRLGDRCQRVIRGFYLQELPLADVARQLGLANAQVAKTLRYRCYQRWLKELRREMSERKNE